MESSNIKNMVVLKNLPSNMVEEAIYQTAQEVDSPEMARQAEKIYEILISDDPESELEKYYDVAPNSYLKEFAGVSYLTK